jgi:hypothetical protein
MHQFTRRGHARVGPRIVFVGVLGGLIATGVALLAVFGFASAGGAAAAPAQYQYQGPPQDLVTGSGKITSNDFPNPGDVVTEQFIVGAQSGPAGEDPDGQITLHSPLLTTTTDAKADVTCMIVSGNHAQVGGMFREPVGYAGFTLRWIEVIIDDGGPPGQGTDTMNAFVFIDRPRPPGFSPCNFIAPTDFEVAEGNYTVTDGVEHGSGRVR